MTEVQFHTNMQNLNHRGKRQIGWKNVLAITMGLGCLLLPTIKAQQQPPSPQIPPAGTFYLLERTKVNTDTGIAAFPTGTRVERVSETGGKIRVKADGRVFDVEKTKLTNDLDVVKVAQEKEEQQVAKQKVAMQEAAQQQASQQQAAQQKANQLIIKAQERMAGQQKQKDDAEAANAANAQSKARYAAALRTLLPRPGNCPTIGKHIISITGEVLQVLPDGLLIASGYLCHDVQLQDDGSLTSTSGGTILDQPLFIVGARKTYADGDTFKALLYPAGRYSYTSALGSGKTVYCYSPSAEIAAERGAQ